jgi:hypothetical protein
VDFAVGGGFCRRWLEPDQLNACGGGGFCRRRRWIFAVAAAGALEPDQLNACGGGGFCRRCCWSPTSRTLRQRWILPSLLLEPSNPTS